MAHSTRVPGLIPGSRLEAPDVHPINSRLERHSWQNPGKGRKFLAPKNLPAVKFMGVQNSEFVRYFVAGGSPAPRSSRSSGIEVPRRFSR